MIALTARTYLKQRQNAQKEQAQEERSLSRFLQVEAPARIPPAPAASVSAPLAGPAPATPVGSTPRPTARDPEQATLFGRIFKEDVGGVSTLSQAQRDDLYRRGIFVWDGVSPELRRWFDKWRRGGRIAFL
jgi:hypothetical protein